MSAHGCFKACPEEGYCAASAATMDYIFNPQQFNAYLGSDEPI